MMGAQEKKGTVYRKQLLNGLLEENPVFRLVLGTCPTLAISTSLSTAIGMGVSVIFVLVFANAAISALRRFIPDKVRIPAYITVIATLVSILQMLLQAFLPALYQGLGIYLPLIVVNCLLLARAELFASKNPLLLSVVDGVSMGVGFTASLAAMALVRELLGSGTLLGYTITKDLWTPIAVFALPPGGFFVFGCLVALTNRLARKKGRPAASRCGDCGSCGGCPSDDEDWQLGVKATDAITGGREGEPQ